MLLNQFLLLAAFLFCTGVYGVIARQHTVLVLMSIELMLAAVNINLVAFGASHNNGVGQVFALFVLTIAAAEVGVGLAIVLLIYRNLHSADLDDLDRAEGLSGRHDDSFLDHAWLVPLIPALSFVVILLFGKRLPRHGSEVGIAAVGASFVLACGAWSSGSSTSSDAAGRKSRSARSARSIGRRGAARRRRAGSARSCTTSRGSRTAASSSASASRSTASR